MKPITPNKISQDIVSILEQRLKDEYDAFMFYRAASNWCNNIGFTNAGKYFDQESNDELLHAKGIEDFLVDWNMIPQIPTITKPELKFEGLVDIINQAHQIETSLYDQYNKVSRSLLDKNPSIFDFLQKYRDIQNKSVIEYSDMLNSLALINTENKFELFYWEKENFQ